jgi:hypothetical protein
VLTLNGALQETDVSMVHSIHLHHGE